MYIGQTVRQLEVRIKEHKRHVKTQTYIFYNAIRKYGWDNFEWEIIDKAETLEELNNKEIYWINEYKSNNSNYGYNMNSGGKNSIPNEITRLKIGKGNKGKEISKEIRAKMGKHLKGKNLSDEHKLKIKNSVPKKRIINVDTMQIYESLIDAGKSINGLYTSIRKSCTGKNVTAYGYRWMYYDEYIKYGIFERTDKRGKNKKKIINIDTNKIYQSSLEAMEDTSVDSSCIIKVCKGKRSTAGGFRWQYLGNQEINY